MGDIINVIWQGDETNERAAERQKAMKKFQHWMGAGNKGRLNLNHESLSAMYGTALLTALSHVYVAGYRIRRSECGYQNDFEGAWENFEIAMKAEPDYFRAYAYGLQDCDQSLYTVFMMGYFAT